MGSDTMTGHVTFTKELMSEVEAMKMRKNNVLTWC